MLRRFGEDDPNAVITEIAFSTPQPVSIPAVHHDGSLMSLDEAVKLAVTESRTRGLARLYVVDRTAGAREQEVMHHLGDHSTGSALLSDTDEEDGVTGSTMLDRPHDAGFLR